EHWQSVWHRGHPDWHRLRGVDWDTPTLDVWLAGLDTAIHAIGGPVALVCHSLGCIAAAEWASEHGAGAVVAALLAAPPDLEQPDTPAEIRDFAPLPRRRLPFPSILVSSNDDPYCTAARAASFAAAWGSQHLSLGTAGHINTEAGYGLWPEGLTLLAGLLRTF